MGALQPLTPAGCVLGVPVMPTQLMDEVLGYLCMVLGCPPAGHTFGVPVLPQDELSGCLG